MTAFKRAFLFILTLAMLAAPFVIFFKAQAITDWWQLRNYIPSSSVVNLATQDTFTPYARHVFYVNHPSLETDASQFRTDCNETEKTIVLGCYHGNQAGIFVYNVNDPRLAGVQQVTAAHEMLHAVYDRLSSKDKNYIDGLLQNYYDHDLHDQRIIDTINSYKQSEPNDVVNEMHSIFGTEVASLPTGLQTYYARYFLNRQTVTNFANSYQAEFTSRSDQIKADDIQLAQLKVVIDQEENLLNQQLNQISSDRTKLDSQRSAGQISQYNASVNSFNNEVNNYNNGVGQLRGNITTYNQLVEARNTIAKELASLSQALDTRLTPQTAQ